MEIDLVSSNTHTTNWRSPHKITKDEIPLKLTLIDRLDLIFGLREPTSEREIRDYANNMLELSKMAGVATNRTFDSIFRITGAFARVKLKNIIDTETANEAIKFIREMYLQYGQPIAEIADPKSIAYLGDCKDCKRLRFGCTYKR